MTVDIRKVDIIPVCPFCDKEVDELVEVKRTGWFTVKWMVLFRPWPMCRRSVTLGGGIMIT